MKTMVLSAWYVSVVALLAFDTRTRALQQNDLEPRLCYQCPPSNNTSCDVTTLVTLQCPPERPYCATFATAPNFTSSLTCAAVTEKSCSFIYSTKQTYEMSCVCKTNQCNAPFTQQLQNELINFSSFFMPRNERTDLTETFWKSTPFVNASIANLYKMITVAITEATDVPTQVFSKLTTHNKNGLVSTMTTHVRHSDNKSGPRVAALKQETTMPSDDDEDGSEGSGSYEDGRAAAPGHPASAPAAPSSYLPADKSKAPPLFTSVLTTTLLIFHLFM